MQFIIVLLFAFSVPVTIAGLLSGNDFVFALGFAMGIAAILGRRYLRRRSPWN